MTVSFTAELWQLKQHLQCAHHTGRHCYVNPISGEHEFQDVYKLTSWAKSVVSFTVIPFDLCLSSL